MRLSRVLMILTAIFLLMSPVFWPWDAIAAVQNIPPKGPAGLTEAKIARIEHFITRQMKQGKIPGLAIAIVKGDRVVYKRGFGFANVRRKLPVTSRTMFELGSSSKAFTALGILLLEDKGLLNRKDPVKKYIPWFKIYKRKKVADPTLDYLNQYLPWFYVKENMDITIEQLLSHTSGINGITIADIPSSGTPDSLEKTVRILMRKVMKPELDYYPGERFSYATINYDILGLIIAKVSGQSYEDFMKENILNPLGLSNTVLFRSEAGKALATGYKVGFLRPLEYNAPVYRGNTPAGYVITSADDMAGWLKIQLGTADIALSYQTIISRSHHDYYDYNYGWYIYRIGDNEKIFHGGANPNYSSYIEFRPQEKLGIALLFNSNSGFSQGIGEGIINIIHDRGRIPERLFDMYVNYDSLACLFILVMGVVIWLTVRFTMNRYKSYPKYAGITGKNSVKFIIFLILLIVFVTGYYFVPNIFFGYYWEFLAVWGPVTILIALALVFVEILIVYGYLFNVCFFEGKRKNIRVKVEKSFR